MWAGTGQKRTEVNVEHPNVEGTCAYQGVRNVRFLENLTGFVFLKHRF